MTDRTRTIRGTIDLSAGEVLSLAANLARYIILARLLGTADFGIAAAVALTVQVFQTISNMALNMLIVQSKDGDKHSLQATAHSLEVFRGLVTAALISMLAWPISELFGVPHARWAFQWLAIVPVLEGFIHLDVHRMEREMRFRPGIAVAAVPKILAAVAAWPLAVWLRDYSAMLWVLIAQSAATLTLSHLLANRRYSLAWDRGHLPGIFSFAWPLLLNGILVFGVFQGDRLIVGTLYTMTDLAVYSVAAGLVMTLSGALFKVVRTLMLPPLSRAQQDDQEFFLRYKACAVAFSLIAALYGPLLIIAGEPLVVFVYGEPYRSGGLLLAWLAAAQSIRILRLAPSLAAMAKGDTKCLMYANIFRISGVGAAAIVALAGADLPWVARAAVMGEILAFPVAMLHLARYHNVPMGICLRPASIAVACMAASGLLVAVGVREIVIRIVLLVMVAVIVMVLMWGLFAFSSLRRRLELLSDFLWPKDEVAPEREV